MLFFLVKSIFFLQLSEMGPHKPVCNYTEKREKKEEKETVLKTTHVF